MVGRWDGGTVRWCDGEMVGRWDGEMAGSKFDELCRGEGEVVRQYSTEFRQQETAEVGVLGVYSAAIGPKMTPYWA